MDTKSNKGIVRFVPNALTIGRLVLTVVFLFMVIYAGNMDRAKPAGFLLVAFILFIVTSLTDIVDGYIARRYNVTSKFGRMTDPAADKILICGAFICFAIVGQPKLANFNFSPTAMVIFQWATALIITIRELWVTIRRHIAEARGVAFGAVWGGKIKMFLQSFAVGTITFGWAYVSRAWGDWFTLITLILILTVTIVSGVQSIVRPIKKNTPTDQ